MDERTVPDLEARTTLGLRQVVKVVVRMKTRTAHRTDGVMKLGREIEIKWDGISSCGSSFFLPFPSLFFLVFNFFNFSSSSSLACYLVCVCYSSLCVCAIAFPGELVDNACYNIIYFITLSSLSTILLPLLSIPIFLIFFFFSPHTPKKKKTW